MLLLYLQFNPKFKYEDICVVIFKLSNFYLIKKYYYMHPRLNPVN